MKEYALPKNATEDDRLAVISRLHNDERSSDECYFVHDRIFHPIYRKGDGILAWFKSKWHDWRNH